MTSVATAAPAATAAATTERTTRAGRSVRTTLFYLLLVVIALIFITPYLFSVFAAFKPLDAILAQSPWRPHVVVAGSDAHKRTRHAGLPR